MSQPPRGLGKGLSAILGNIQSADDLRSPVAYSSKPAAGENTAAGATADVVRIPVNLIEPNPFQPRQSFDQEALEELAESIRTLGLIQPVTVRQKAADKYQIISGERRFRACRLCGMDLIPAYVRDADDQGMLEMAIVENIQRENLDPIEIALSYQRLIDECRLTQEQMALRVGKKRASVTNYLRLLKLPAKIQHDLKVGQLSVGHAKVLLSVEDSRVQEALCDLVVKEGLSVRELEKKIQRLQETSNDTQTAEAQDLPDEYFKVLEIVGRYFDNSISLKRTPSGKGSMTIRFNSDEEMRKFLTAIEKI